MTFGAMIAMCRDKGIRDEDEVGCVIGYFDGFPATDFYCDVWPADRAEANLNRPKTIDFRKRRKDVL